MYCIKCGAKLADGQTICPICETKVYHPDIEIVEQSTYPKIPFESEEYNRNGIMFVITMLFLIPLLIPLLLELSWSDWTRVTWSGYASIGTLIVYTAIVMPNWFKRPSPAIFTPVTFALIILLLWFICFTVREDWFFTFALPITASLGAILTTSLTLYYYVRKGYLYIWGGTLIALGLWTVLLEYDISTTFDVFSTIRWSFAPLTVFCILGLTLIIVAIVKPFKESLRRKFFIGKVKI